MDVNTQNLFILAFTYYLNKLHVVLCLKFYLSWLFPFRPFAALMTSMAFTVHLLSYVPAPHCITEGRIGNFNNFQCSQKYYNDLASLFSTPMAKLSVSYWCLLLKGNRRCNMRCQCQYELMYWHLRHNWLSVVAKIKITVSFAFSFWVCKLYNQIFICFYIFLVLA